MTMTSGCSKREVVVVEVVVNVVDYCSCAEPKKGGSCGSRGSYILPWSYMVLHMAMTLT